MEEIRYHQRVEQTRLGWLEEAPLRRQQNRATIHPMSDFPLGTHLGGWRGLRLDWRDGRVGHSGVPGPVSNTHTPTTIAVTWGQINFTVLNH